MPRRLVFCIMQKCSLSVPASPNQQPVFHHFHCLHFSSPVPLFPVMLWVSCFFFSIFCWFHTQLFLVIYFCLVLLPSFLFQSLFLSSFSPSTITYSLIIFIPCAFHSDSPHLLLSSFFLQLFWLFFQHFHFYCLPWTHFLHTATPVITPSHLLYALFSSGKPCSFPKHFLFSSTKISVRCFSRFS
jgi:hypothetical protein